MTCTKNAVISFNENANYRPFSLLELVLTIGFHTHDRLRSNDSLVSKKKCKRPKEEVSVVTATKAKKNGNMV